MDTFSIVSLAISIMMLAFVVIGVLYGLIVGFKKSLASGIYNFILVIVLIFVTSSLTTLVLNLDISSFNLQVEGTVCKTLGDYIIAMIESNPEISNTITNHPELKDVILSLPSLIASPIIFVVLFWAIKIVVFIISLPINLIIFLCGRKKKKPVDERGKVIKPKKHRLLGMAGGFVVGLIAIFATMVPVFGLGSVIIKLDEIKTTDSGSSLVVYASNEEENNQKSLLSSLLGEETSAKLIETYKNNVGINITRIVGMEALGSSAFNNLTKTTINGNEVKLLDDLNSVITVYNDISVISDYLNKETLTQDEMTDMLTKCDKTINTVFEVKFLTAVGNTVLPIVVDSILNDPNFPVQLPDEIKNDEVKNYIVSQALITLQEYDFSFVKDVLLDLTSIFKTLNENRILTPIYNSLKTDIDLTSKQYINLIKQTNIDFASSIATKLTSINFVKDMSPTLIDGAFEGVFNVIGKTYATNNITKEKASQTLSSIIENLINAAKTLDADSELYVTKNSFGYIGKALDALKDTAVLSATQYNDLIDYVKTEAKDLTNSLPITLTGVIDNLGDVDVWETELNKISLAFDDINEFYSEIKTSGVNIETIDLSKIGKMFDKLELTTLFGGEIRPIYNDILETSKEGLTDYSQALELLKIQDSDLTDLSLTKVDWEKELTSLNPLISELFKFKDLTLSTDKQANANKLIDLCKKFDEVEQDKNSKIYSKKMQPLLTEAMTIAKNQDAENTELYDDIITSLNNRTFGDTTKTLTYCVEKGAITYAVDSVIKEVTTEHGIKDALTTSRTYIIENNTIEKLFDSLDTINTELDSLKTINATDIQNVNIDTLSSSLNTIKNTGSFPVKFTNHILSTILGEVDYSDLPEGETKTSIDNYISEKQSFLNNENSVITNTTYKEILEGLKNLIPTE